MIKRMQNALPLLLGYGFSLLGDMVYIYGMNWFLVEQTHQTELLGLINGISGIVLIVANVFAGPIVDSFNRKHMMIFADLLSGVTCFMCAFLLRDVVAGKLLLILTSSVLNVSLALIRRQQKPLCLMSFMKAKSSLLIRFKIRCQVRSKWLARWLAHCY